MGPQFLRKWRRFAGEEFGQLLAGDLRVAQPRAVIEFVAILQKSPLRLGLEQR